MSHCYLCGVLLDKSNSSVEHIIPNALGGNIKSRQLLCKKCNSNTGQNVDSELSKQLNFFANMLNIRRDRGEPQEFKIKDEVSGVLYRCLPGGNINNICNIKQILFNENTVLDYVKPCYLNYELIGKDVDEVLHSILIYGDRKLGKLYCYIEYFNAIKYIVLLSNNYAGETINKFYIFDVLERKELSNPNINTNWYHNIDGIFENLKLDSKQLEVSLENLLKVISNKQHNEHVNQLIDEAWNSTMNMFELSEGDIITEAVYDKLIEKTVDLLIPHLNGLMPKD